MPPHAVHLPEAGLDHQEGHPVAAGQLEGVVDRLAHHGGADEDAEDHQGDVHRGQQDVEPQRPHHAGGGVVVDALGGLLVVMRLGLGLLLLVLVVFFLLLVLLLLQLLLLSRWRLD